jgi:hypothetical protein
MPAQLLPLEAERPASRLLGWTFILLLPWFLDAPRVLSQGWAVARMDVPTCATEIHIYDGIRSVAEGRPLYPALDEGTYVYRLYNPLTYLPAGLAARWLQCEPETLWFAGRVVPLVCLFVILATAAWYVGSSCPDRRWAILVVVMLLEYHSSTLTDFFRNRPEMPGIACTLLGWVLVQRRVRGWPYWAAACIVAGFALKQVFLAAPLAVVLQLVWQRDWGNLARFTAASVGGGLTLLAVCFACWGGAFFEHTVLAMQSNPVHPWKMSAFFYPILVRRHWGWLALLTLLAVGWLVRRRRHAGLLIYLAVVLVWTSLLHGKVGADINYHAELSILMVMTTVVALADVVAIDARASALALGLLVVAAWGPVLREGPFWNDVCTNRIQPRPHGFSMEPPLGDVRPYVERLAAHRGAALIFQSELAARVGRPVLLDWLTVKMLAEAGRRDLSPLHEAIRQGQYEVIVMDRSFEDSQTRALLATARDAGYQEAWRDEYLVALTPGMDGAAMGPDPKAAP